MAFLLWSLALLLLLLGTWLTLRRLKKIPKPNPGLLPPVSILKPLKGADQGLRENLESFFALEYPHYEILFSIADERDPACSVVRRLMKSYPGKAKLIIGAEEIGLNPKVNNLVRSYEAAQNDLLLISDSNVKVKPDYLNHVVAHLSHDVGVITAIVAGTDPSGLGGHLEAIYLNTFYARGMNLAYFAGKPCVIGKSMMFRKSNAEKFGGLRFTSNFVAEDFVIGEEMRKLGLKIVLMRDPVQQFIGNYSFRSFWLRHIRWGRIRKSQAILPFLLEPLVTPIVSSLMAGICFSSVLPVSVFMGFLLQFSLYCACDLWIASQLMEKVSWKMLGAWVIREVLSIPMWLVVASGNSVDWRGCKLQLKRGGKIQEKEIPCLDHFFGAQPQAHTRWRDTISTATGGTGRNSVISREAPPLALPPTIGIALRKI